MLDKKVYDALQETEFCCLHCLKSYKIKCLNRSETTDKGYFEKGNFTDGRTIAKVHWAKVVGIDAVVTVTNREGKERWAFLKTSCVLVTI